MVGFLLLAKTWRTNLSVLGLHDLSKEDSTRGVPGSAGCFSVCLLNKAASRLIPRSAVGAAGLMKLPHAVALHGIQVLGVLAWVLLFTTWNERRRVAIVTIGAIGFVGLLLAMLVQTYSGLAPFDLSLPLALLLAVSVLSLIAAYASAAAALWRTLSPLPTHK